MNARDYLNNEIAELQEIDSTPETIAALRELDQLLADFAKYIAENCDGEECDKLKYRAAQAGYGEK